MNFLIVVDMQNDFISGSLGSPHSADIVVNVAVKVFNFIHNVYHNVSGVGTTERSGDEVILHIYYDQKIHKPHSNLPFVSLDHAVCYEIGLLCILNEQ